MAIDINRGTSGVIKLPAEVSSEIWSNTLENSAVQARARKVALPAGGLTIPMITGDPEAGWVNETDEKPVSDSKFGSKVMTPYKMAVIELFSDEFRRDLPGLYAELVRRLPYALGRKFDKAALGIEEAPGTGFDTLADAPEIALDGTIKPFLSGLKSVAANKGVVDGWTLTEEARVDALNIADSMNRPLLVSDYSTAGQVGTILGKPVSTTRAIDGSNVAGFAGEWSSAVWGAVEDIQIDINDRGSVTRGGEQINLWQRNMFAVRAEIEVGFVLRDPKRFVKFTSAGDSGAGESGSGDSGAGA